MHERVIAVSVCLCTVDLRGRCTIMVERGTNVKRMI